MTDELVLDLLIKNNEFVSGEWISESLNISRTAVWKAINKLKSKGYMIESVPHKGYRFISSGDLLSSNELGRKCDTNMLGKKIYYYESCESTNDEARSGSIRGDSEGSVYISDSQTKGRGRLGRSWKDNVKKGIAMSLLLHPMISPTQIMPVSLIAGLAITKALAEVCKIKCQVKWPNDVVINNKKVAGVLIEMSTSGEMVQYIIVGMGINCNNSVFDDDIKDIATSVFLESGQTVSRKELICRILKIFEEDYFKWIDEMYESEDHLASFNKVPSYVAEYKSYCININKKVVVHQRDQSFEGVATDISPLGELIMDIDGNEKRHVLSGEVSIRGLYGYV